MVCCVSSADPFKMSLKQTVWTNVRFICNYARGHGTPLMKLKKQQKIKNGVDPDQTDCPYAALSP